MSKFAKGKYALAISDRSGQAFPWREMVTEWNGAFVHLSEYEPKQPQLEPKPFVADPQGLANARPQRFPSDQIGGGNMVANLTLPGNFAFNGDELLPVRVRDIILDVSHPEIVSNKFTGTDGIGVIKYIPIDQSEEETNTQNLPFAFPLNSFHNTLPLKNEVVLLIKAPRAEETIKQIDYYISIVGLFNDINYIPSTSEDLKENENPGYDFKANVFVLI